MSRTPDLEVQSLDLRVLSMARASQVALAEPPASAAAIVEDADIELAGASEGEGADVGFEPAVGAAITPVSGTPVSWSELDEWLEAS